MTTKRLIPILLIAVSLLIALAGCRTTEIIQVRITPTPDPEAVALEPSPTPTDDMVSVEQATATATPTVTVTPTVTPTTTPTATTTPDTDEPTPTSMTFIGPIIGGDYQSPTPPPSPTEQEFEEIPTTTPPPVTPIVTTTPIATATPTDGPTPTPLPRLDADRMGLQLYANVEFDDWMRVIGTAQETGVGWVKVQVDWAFLQPDGRDEFGTNFQLFERKMEAVKRAGFNLLLSVAKAPDWARSDTTESGPPDDPADLAYFLNFLLRETKIGGVTDAIEVWNEPNLIREWRGVWPMNGASYMEFFRVSYDTIRAYSPDITIITAGLAPVGAVTDATVDDRVFLQQMYDNGLGNYTDVAIGAHPYGWGNPPDARCCPSESRGWDDSPYFFFLDNLEAIYDVMRRNGHEDNRIWLTEFGWATWEGITAPPPEPWVTFNSAQDQADYNIRAFEIGLELPYVGNMILWNLNFANEVRVNQSEEVTGYSLINPVLSPPERPAFHALIEATGGRRSTE